MHEINIPADRVAAVMAAAGVAVVALLGTFTYVVAEATERGAAMHAKPAKAGPAKAAPARAVATAPTR